MTAPTHSPFHQRLMHALRSWRRRAAERRRAHMARVIREAGVKPELEIFDSGDINLALDLIADGTLDGPAMWTFVLGVKYGFAPTPETLLYARNMKPAADGAPGWMTGDIVGISALFDKLPKPSYDDNLAGTRAFFRELNRLGVTGLVDPGGFSIAPSQYAALFELWREKALTLRVAYSVFAQKPGAELQEFRELTQMLPMGFGDDMRSSFSWRRRQCR